MRQVGLHGLIDHAKFNRFHWIVLIWCSLIIIFDGYDLAVAGAALPSIMKQMGVSPTNAGFMMSSALFGMMFGAIFLGTLSDKIGRRWTIAVCIGLFSLFTAAAGLTTEPIGFSITRFIAGLGIGGVMPNVVAHMSEYSPKRIRATMVTLMFSGYAVGGMLAAVLGKGLIESHGWQAVFFAAAAPVLLLPFMLKTLPESPTFLIKKRRTEELKKITQQIDPTYRPQADDEFALPPASAKTMSVGVGRLFHDGRGLSTVMFWLAFFMCLFMVYALSSWLAKLMANAGYSLGSALTFVLVLNFGAMIGAIGGGWLADRFNIKTVQIVFYVLAAVSITSLGYPLPLPLLYLMVGLAGASTIGTQIVTYAFVGQYYPHDIRSTGIGWASGVGRMGAILAPILIGPLVAANLPLQMNFLAIALPAVVAARGGRPLRVFMHPTAVRERFSLRTGSPRSIGMPVASRGLPSPAR